MVNPRADALTRGLAVEAAGLLADARSLHALLALVTSDDAHLRTEALRALARRADGREPLRELLVETLRKRRDIGTVMAILDLVEERPDPGLIPDIEPLTTFLEPVVKDAAEHALAVLRYEKQKALAKKADADGYAVNPPPGSPGPPGPRPRFDLVFAFDSTGSLAGQMPAILERIRGRYRFLADLGSDVRVGIVVFRDARRGEHREPVTILPLTHDLVAVEAFLAKVRTSGVDSQGAAVRLGLTEGLGRMTWREKASRTFILIADTRCDDPKTCAAIAAMHRKADGTRVRVLYVLRTRGTIPDDLKELARAGGGALEVLE
jgi:hypothetical protein